MKARWSGVARAVLTVGACAGLVVAATTLSGATNIGPPVVAPTESSVEQVPVTSATTDCPGPETPGLAGVPAVVAATTVYGAAAPAAALQGIDIGASQTGTVTVAAPPGGKALATATTRGSTASTRVAGPVVVQVAGRAALAPALAGLQVTNVPSGDDRAQVATACTQPRGELWFVGGGGQSTRRERIVLVNPGGNTITADVTVHGQKGKLPALGRSTVTVPPLGRTSLLLDALVGAETTPVVHVVASGGALTGVLEDSWIDGAVGRGADDAMPAADPGTSLVVPAVSLNGPGLLRIANPGDTEAVVQSRALTTTGPTALPGAGVVRVPAGAVREIDLSSLPPGAYAMQVRSDQPVVAGAMVERRGDGKGQSDLAWTAATSPVDAVAGVPLPDATSCQLVLAATDGSAGAQVFTVDAAGAVQQQTYTIAADSVAAVDVSGKRGVWVRHTSGTLTAGLTLAPASADGTPLFSIVPLWPLVVSATQVPVRLIP